MNLACRSVLLVCESIFMCRLFKVYNINVKKNSKTRTVFHKTVISIEIQQGKRTQVLLRTTVELKEHKCF